LNNSELRENQIRVAARAFVMTVLLWLMVFSVAAQQRENPPIGAQIDWQRVPSGGSLGQIAEVQISDGYVFSGAKDTRKLLEAMHNPTNGHELGFLAPAGADWFRGSGFSE
jgi:hypothetical protein